MSNPPQRIIKTLLKFHLNVIHNQTQISSSITKPLSQNARRFSTNLSNGFANSALKASKTYLNPCFPSSVSRPISSNGVLCPRLSSWKSSFGVYCRNYSVGNVKVNGISVKTMGFEKLVFNPLRIRQFSTKMSNFGSKLNAGKMNKNAAKKVVEKPLSAISSLFARYRGAIGLQIEGFWKRNFLLMVGAGGVMVCIVLWRIMFGIANTFVGLSEGMAKYGFLALSSAMVAFAVSLLHFCILILT